MRGKAAAGLRQTRGIPRGAVGRRGDNAPASGEAPRRHPHRQEKRLASILVHASTRVPLYVERTRGLSPESIAAEPRAALEEFPPLERDDLRNHLDDLTCEMGRGTMSWATGGSTGIPVRFRRDRHCLAATLAATQLFNEWAGGRRGDQHIKVLSELRGSTRRRTIGNRVADSLNSRIMLDAYRMTKARMREYVEVMNRQPPVLLEGYANTLDHFAGFMQREGLSIPPPRAVLSEASMLLPAIRERLETTFRAAVFDRYGTREVSGIASECDAHDGLHIMSETTLLELVDDRGRAVDEGETGDVLLTSLWNYTMPLIRYRVGDRAARGATHCSCGRPYPKLASIEGRSTGGFIRHDGTMVFQGHLMLVMGEECDPDHMIRYQIVQETVDRIVVMVVPPPGTTGLSADERERVAEGIRDAMCAPCEVDFELVDDIEPTPAGKHLHVVSKLPGSSGVTRGASPDCEEP